MNCPRCRALIVANDVNLEHLLAKCGSCQEVFRFAPEEIEAVTDRVLERIVSPNPLKKAKAPRPGSILVEDWALVHRTAAGRVARNHAATCSRTGGLNERMAPIGGLDHARFYL
jgi:hypothetical protein